MTPDQFKSELAPLVAGNQNREAVAFVQLHLKGVRGQMSAEDRMLIADWMEGVEMALDLDNAESEASRTAST